MLEITFMLDDSNGTIVGHGSMPHAPRIDELIWLQAYNLRDGSSSLDEFQVVAVAYWVPNYKGGFGSGVHCSSAAVYVRKKK